jgi:4-nitrophenol 2-monooxygenase / 4-nitrocatechol 4-monooxygenase, reductase component
MTTRSDDLVSAADFRGLIGVFATGVTVVTTVDRGMSYGTTASALSSVSLDPPTLLVCMNRASRTGHAIAASGHFAVNVLGEDQEVVARHFARPGSDFSAYATTRGRRGSPLLADALASFECRVTDAVEAGTHTVLIGAVEAAKGRHGMPLAYFRGRFGRLSLEQVAE